MDFVEFLNENDDSSSQCYVMVCADENEVSSTYSQLGHSNLNSPHSITSSDHENMSPLQAVPHLDHWTVDILNKYTTAQQNVPYLEIVEQPADMFRFRYKSEMNGTHGCITGVNSNKDKNRTKTFPTVKLNNYTRVAKIICTLVQSEETDIPSVHPHQLVSRNLKDEPRDPHVVDVGPMNKFIARFSNLSIVHTAKKNVHTELYQKRKDLCTTLKKELSLEDDMQLRMHCQIESRNINMNSVKLCFSAYDAEFNQICDPVTSNSIDNLKSAETGALKISRMSKSTGSVLGGEEIFMFVEKVSRKNIKVRFFEMDGEKIIWEGYGSFNETDVHHQFGIVFRTPPYKDKDINKSIKVYVELVRPKDGAVSEPKYFEYQPAVNNSSRRRAATNLMSSLMSSGSISESELPSSVLDRKSNNAFINKPKRTCTLADALYHDDSGVIKKDINLGVQLKNNSLDNINRVDLAFNSPFQSSEMRDYDCFDDGIDSFTEMQPSSSLTIDGHKSHDENEKCTLQISDDKITDTKPVLVMKKKILPLKITIKNHLNPPKLIDLKNFPMKRIIITKSTAIRKTPPDNDGNVVSVKNTELLVTSPEKCDAASDLETTDDKVSNTSSEELKTNNVNLVKIEDKNELYRQTDKDSALKAIKLIQVLTQSKPNPEAAEKLLDTFEIKLLDGDSLLHMFVATDYVHILKVLLELIRKLEVHDILNYVNDKRETALHTAVTFFRHETMALLLSAGCDPNLHDADGNTPLHIAVKQDNSECMVQLLDKNNYGSKYSKFLNVNTFNNDGWTPLHLAALYVSLASVSRLINAGADFNIPVRSNGRNILHLAVTNAHTILVSFILEHTNIDVNARDDNGYTALHLCCSLDDRKSHEICQILLTHGAIPHIKFNNMTAFDLAKSNINIEVLNVLKNHRVLPNSVKNTGKHESENTLISQRTLSSKFDEIDVSNNLEKRNSGELQNSVENTEKHKSENTIKSRSTLISEFDEIDIKEEPIEFNEKFSLSDNASKVVTRLLNSSGMWKIIAVHLGLNDFIDLCRKSNNPAKMLVDYVELEQKLTLSEFHDLLVTLGELEAANAVKNNTKN